MSYIKKVIKRMINSAGFSIHRLSNDSNVCYQLLKGIKRFEVDLVLDVGANIGQFSSELRSVGFQDHLVSFEPLSKAHQELEKAAGGDSHWTVHPRCAIGAHDGEVEINIAGNSASSSILSMMESHASAAPESTYVSAEKVPIFKLDTVALPYLEKARNPFLKIDTQGYEWHVLDGASAIVPRMRGVLCELSLVPLYEGQRLWLEIIQRLEHEGFTLWSIQMGFADPRDGRTLQVDAIFFRM